MTRVVMPKGMNLHRGMEAGVGFGEDSGCGYGYGMGGGGTLGESFGDDTIEGLFSFLGKAAKGIINIAGSAIGVGAIFPPGSAPAGQGTTVTTQYVLANSTPYDLITSAGKNSWRWPVGNGKVYATAEAMKVDIDAAIKAGVIPNRGPTSNPAVPASGVMGGSTPTGSAPDGPGITIPGINFGSSTGGGGGLTISPTLLIAGAALAVVLLSRRRK